MLWPCQKRAASPLQSYGARNGTSHSASTRLVVTVTERGVGPFRRRRWRSALSPVCARPVRARAEAWLFPQEAKSDLVSLLSSLEAHWHVLESEVVEVSRDAEYCEQCLRKYGECFSAPMHSLRVRARPQTTHLRMLPSSPQPRASAHGRLTLRLLFSAQELKRFKKKKMCACTARCQ